MKLLPSPKSKIELVEAGECVAEHIITAHMLNLQWTINKAKKDTSIDYKHRILFAKFKLEKASGQSVKLRI